MTKATPKKQAKHPPPAKAKPESAFIRQKKALAAYRKSGDLADLAGYFEKGDQ